MAGDTPQGEPARPGCGMPPILDLAFDTDTLHALRAEVRTYARQAGLPDRRAGDVVWPFTNWRPTPSATARDQDGYEYGTWLEHCTARLTTAVRWPPEIRPDRERSLLAASLPRWEGLRPDRNELVACQARPRPVGCATSRRPDTGPVRSSRYSRHGHLRPAFLKPRAPVRPVRGLDQHCAYRFEGLPAGRWTEQNLDDGARGQVRLQGVGTLPAEWSWRSAS